MADHARGRPIRRVDVLDAGVLRGTSGRALDRVLRGRRFDEPRRHGKWLICPTVAPGERRAEPPAALLHFGMTGDLAWTPGGDVETRHRHDRVVFVLEGGELRYRDMRKLQGLRLAEDDQAVERVLAGLGPDALGLPRDAFRERLGSGRRRVKAALIDQAVIAGLGNLLADEILWRARTAPQRPVRELDEDDLAELHRAMGRVLRGAIPTGRVPPRSTWLTGARDRDDARCPRCGAALSRGRVGGRTTVWCPRCQPR